MLRKFRKERRLTQSELARIAGLSRDHLGRIERGDEPGTLGTWAAICFAMNVDLSEFGFSRERAQEPVDPELETPGEVSRIQRIPVLADGDHARVAGYINLDGVGLVPSAEGDGHFVMVKKRAPQKGDAALVVMNSGASYVCRWFPKPDGLVALAPLPAAPGRAAQEEPVIARQEDIRSACTVIGCLWDGGGHIGLT